jgi:hypothetical protein
MPNELPLPQSLWSARDAAIGSLCNDMSDPSAEEDIEAWVDEHGEVAFYEFGGAAIGTMHVLEAEDSEVRDRLEIDPETAITDQDRAAYVRLEVQDTRAEFYGPYLEGYPISDHFGNKAVLAAKSYCCGQGGWEFEWFGLFPTREAAIKTAVDQGFFIDSWVPEGRRIEEYSVQELIAFVGC